MNFKKHALGISLLVVLAFGASDASAAQPTVGLGTATSFAVLAGSTVTNTGPTTVNGDLGVSPGNAITGFPPGIVNGTIHAGDAVALQAKSDLVTAYNDAAGRTPATAVAADLGGQTLAPGVYNSASSLGLTGALTLDGQGNADSVFIFQAGSSLTTASASSVNLINGAQACHVFWQVGSSATLGTASTFTGNILALTSVSINDGVTVDGRALARNGAVTMINDTITASACAVSSSPGGSTVGAGGTPQLPTTGAGGTNGTTPASAVKPPVLSRGGCVTRGFRATVTGRSIRSVVFSVGSHRVATRSKSPFFAVIAPGRGVHVITARVTFLDLRPAKTLRLRYRACAAQAVSVPRATRPTPRPPTFAG